MRLHFEADLDYQLQAIDAVCDIFHGQEVTFTEFTVSQVPNTPRSLPGFSETDLGIGNRLTLLDEELLANLREIQLRNALRPSDSLDSGDFTVEMETGTGKTYVYLRTIFELNRRYGFTKFVIVVPSVAIKEGVYKTLQITDEHFRSLYGGVPFSAGNNYFLYDSNKLSQVRNFATSPQIQVMVVTVGAINKKDVNNLYKDSEKTGGEKPIDLIRATRPVVIVDEPQSVDGGLSGAGKTALGSMNPLCTLRYSATHTDKHHMVYRLDAVDAYDRKLVKQIEVASATVENAHNKPFVRLLSVHSKAGVVSAKVEINVRTKTGIQRQTKVVQDKDDLEQTTGLGLYEGHRVGEIRVAKGKEFLEVQYPGGERFLKPDEAMGDVDALAVQTEMIKRTIKEHLDKEKRLRPKGIKVLSLFFIDGVDKYRRYEDGRQEKGEYALIFEDQYRRFARHPDYRDLFEGVDVEHDAEDVHNGYFSIDRNGGWTDTAEGNQGDRDNAERAYNLIMKEKEKLLGFETPLKFIFSHSALREGWDNPNVFQICTLRDIGTERERRQTIGRGLRLCVNQQGDRVRGFETNTLTVVATESYEQFAQNLQKEIEEDTGIRFGIVEDHQFAAVVVKGEGGAPEPLGFERSKALWGHLKAEGYLDAKGKVQDSLKAALKAGTVSVPEEFAPQVGQIVEILRKLSGKLEIKNADERRTVGTRHAVLHGPDFKALWDRIKHKTTYRVRFDNDRLIEACTQALADAPPIAKTRLQWRKADLAIGKAGVEATEQDDGADSVTLTESDIELPDLLTDLQERTGLTRRTLAKVLVESDRLDGFKRNPQQFIEIAAEAIERCKRLAMVDGIKYQRIGNDKFYAQELFEQEELTGYLKNSLAAKKAVYEEVVYDSDVERNFADQLEKNSSVKVYAKLPGWFTVPTPLGGYNPDWAVLIATEEGERLYFVVETKGSLFAEDLRSKEGAKIACGKAHFSALASGEDPARYVVATDLQDVLERV